jgi:ABC-type nitrate/sulfonate/bicarbonate transport system substrate-binding protein
MTRRLRLCACIAAALLFGTAAGLPDRAAAADKVVIGVVGSPIPLYWPLYIAMKKDYFKAQDLDIDLNYVQSSAAVVQQLTANSIDLTVGVGLVDPIRAIDNGAPIAIVRVIVQAPPYDLAAPISIENIKALKGKIVSIGGPKDITRIYLDRMLEANGLTEKDVDLVYAGSTGARFAALQAKAINATLLTAPYNFYATAAGFHIIGHSRDTNKGLPFLGAAIHVKWANAHPAVVKKFLAAFDQAVSFFENEANRKEAVDIMTGAGKMKREDIERSYDYFRDGKFFAPKSTVSKTELGNLIQAMQQLHDLPHPISIDKLVAPGVTQISD